MNVRAILWSVRRELWENRSIVAAPVIVAALLVIGTLVATAAGNASHGLPLDWRSDKLSKPYDFAAVALMGTTFLVAIVYCLDALYGERRDRSNLFWKSMPVGDLTIVLSKAAIPLVVVPVVTFLLTIATQLVMLLLSSAILMANGQSAVPLWTTLPWVRNFWMLLYHLVTVHSLYYAPIFAWLLLVSAWARRLPFLWAFLPVAAIAIIERTVFGTSRVGSMLGSRISGGMSAGGSGDSMLGHFHPMEFLSRPGLWIGLLVAAVFVAAAVRLRRIRQPI